MAKGCNLVESSQDKDLETAEELLIDNKDEPSKDLIERSHPSVEYTTTPLELNKKVFIASIFAIITFVGTTFGTQFWLDYDHFIAFTILCGLECAYILILVFWTFGYQCKSNPFWWGVLFLIPLSANSMGYIIYVGVTTSMTEMQDIFGYCALTLVGVISFVLNIISIILLICPGMLGSFVDEDINSNAVVADK